MTRAETPIYNAPTWADGFGTWHASVAITTPNREDVARGMIERELRARGNGFEDFSRMSVVQAWYDSRRVVYRESWATDETVRTCVGCDAPLHTGYDTCDICDRIGV